MASRSPSKSTTSSSPSRLFVITVPTESEPDPVDNKKSIWSHIFKHTYLCYHSHFKPSSCKYRTLYGICCLSFLLYFILACYIDVPYWIVHGIKFHRNHFQWKASFDGDYCEYPPLKRTLHHSGISLWNLSQNNHNPQQYRSRVLLLSYPRSGNHLTRAMIECLLQKATYGYTKEKHNIYIPRTQNNQSIAIKTASIETPFIRKIHSPTAVPYEFNSYRDTDVGLIFLIRDPIESVLSDNKYVPYFWKDYQYQFGTNFMRSPTWYKQWNGVESKLLLYYEDYYNADGTTNKEVNLRKLAAYFGDMVAKERLEFCIENYDKVIEIGLGALQRASTSNHDPHYYRDQYFGNNPKDWPKIKVSKDLYPIFERYEDIQSC